MDTTKEGGGNRTQYRTVLDRDEIGQRLGGGLPRGAIVMVEGMEGSGRSVLCQRIAFGCLENGHSVSYVSTEMTMSEHIDQMYSLGYDIGRFMDMNRYLYASLFARTPMLSRADMMVRLRSAKRIYDSDVIVLDSLSAMMPSLAAEGDARDMLSFFKSLAVEGKTLLMSVGLEGQINPLRQSCDVLIGLRTDEDDRSLHHVDVKRYLRAKARIDDNTAFRVEPGIGTVVDLLEVS
jgi:flagellar protein FlaH